MNWLVVAAAVPSFFVSLALCAAIRRLAPRFGLVDRPGHKKPHARPTAYGGGLAIWAAVILPLAAGQVVLTNWQAVAGHDASSAPLGLARLGTWGTAIEEWVEPHLSGLASQSTDLWFLLAAGTVLVALGLVDDLRKLDWRLRLLVEVIVAGAVVFGRGWHFTLFLHWPWLTGALSLLWIVGMVNSFNMLDNMDGLSGGVAAIAASMLGAMLLLVPDPSSDGPQLFVAGLLFVLVGSLVGFLAHNRPPAHIFMGDSGAYFIGFMLGTITILATFSGNGLPRHAILALLCVLAVPLYDTLSVVCIRIAQGRSPFEGDTNHFSHRLVALGLSKTQAVLTIYLTTAACGLGALLLHQVNSFGAVIIVLVVPCLLSVIAILEWAARRARAALARS